MTGVGPNRAVYRAEPVEHERVRSKVSYTQLSCTFPNGGRSDTLVVPGNF